MQSIVENRSWLPRIAAVLAILGHLAAVLTYVLTPMLIAPTAFGFLLSAAWIGVLGLATYFFRRHPWRSVLVVVIGYAVAQAFVVVGDLYLGWNP